MDHNKHERTGEAYIGKGISGSRRYPHLQGNVKVFELEGEWGNKIEFDFTNSVASVISKRNANPSEYFDPAPIVDLEPDPYYYLLRNVALKRQNMGTDLGLPIKTGARILEKIYSQVTSRTKNAKLQTYLLGNDKDRRPPMLEDLLPGGANPIRPLPAI